MTSGTACEKCGAFGDLGHSWTEGTCVLPHRYDKPNHPPAATVGHCCRWCVERHREWLTEIVELYATLEDVLEPGSVVETTGEYQKPRKQPASPAPVRLEAWAMLFDADRLYATGRFSALPDVPSVLSGWAGATFDELHYNATAPNTVTGAVAVLSANAETIAAAAFVDDYDAELTWVRTALRRAHGIVDVQPVGRCPSLDGNGQQCGGPLWADTSGKMSVRCGNCERVFDEQFLRHLGGMMESACCICGSRATARAARGRTASSRPASAYR